MRIGIVCPYSFDVPGGVQFHIRDFAEYLISQGHHVSVLAPADDDTPLADYVESTGRAIPVHYNGSVARLNFGLVAAARVRRWLSAGRFDILHIHEPITPSVGMLALWAASGPIVATFHSSQQRSRALQVAYPFVRSSLEKISARIAVSEDARRTVVEHLGGDAVVIPNGVWVDRFEQAKPKPEWQWTEHAPTFAFLGRIDEPRKGLAIFLAAAKRVVAQHPHAKFFIAGNGDADAARKLPGGELDAVQFLGSVTDEDKAALLSSVHSYVAPQTGGESFGIVLVEAMSAGTMVVSSDLGAFRRVLNEGKLGMLFENGNSEDLANCLLSSLADPDGRAGYLDRAHTGVRRFDWPTVAEQITTIYDMVKEADHGVEIDPASQRPRRR